MGSLKALSDPNCNVHLIQSKSGKANIYIHDTLKATYNATADSFIEVKTKRDLKVIQELSSIQPYNSDKWIFEVTYKAIAGTLKFNKALFESPNICYCVFVDKYKDFKAFKEVVDSCNDLYLSVIRSADIRYLLSGFDISEKVKSFIISSYARDVEKVFELKEYLQQGSEVNSAKDVVKLVGANQNSVAGYVISLLTSSPKTEKGIKMVYRNKMQAGMELCEAYAMQDLRNFMTATVYDIMQIKMLYMEGIIYDSFRGIPEQFDEKKLSRYTRYLDIIENSISYDSILKLYIELQKPENRSWLTKADFMSFLYNYYGGVVVDGVAG